MIKNHNTGKKAVQKAPKTKGGSQKSEAARSENEGRMPLSAKNYILMLIGLGIIIVGFLLMAGGGSDDPNVFNYEMFSFRRITLAPIVVIAGFAFEIYAIMKRFK